MATEGIFRLKLPSAVSFTDVMATRENGAKFICFEYIISMPVFRPIRRMSKVYYIEPSQRIAGLNIKYNLFNLFIGTLGMPYGPTSAFNAIGKNRKGIDVTDDVYENLTEEDFAYSKVVIRKLAIVFSHPSKSSVKELERCFRKYSQNYHFAKKPIFGYYIDTEEPCYYIGLDKNAFEQKEDILKAVYKYFL